MMVNDGIALVYYIFHVYFQHSNETHDGGSSCCCRSEGCRSMKEGGSDLLKDKVQVSCRYLLFLEKGFAHHPVYFRSLNNIAQAFLGFGSIA